MDFWAFLEPLPLHALYSGPRRAQMEQQWEMAHSPVSLSSALNLLVLLSFLLAPLAFIFALALSADLSLSFGLAILLFILPLLCGFYLPSRMAARFSAAAESDLPMALRAIALHLKIKLPFEQALAHAAHSNYASSPLWSAALSSIHSGESVPRALSQMAQQTTSLSLSRAAHALTALYEEGGSPEGLDALADELTVQQMAALRAHSARAGLTGLVFIATSALLPAFFLILAVTAGPLLDFHPDVWAVGLFYILLLPALNALVLLAVVFSAPSMSGSWRPQQMRAQVAEALASRGLPPLTLLQLSIICAALALVSLLLAFLLLPGPLGLVLALTLGLLPLLLYALLEGRVLSDTASVESELPHLLLSGASTSRFSLEKMLEQAARSPSAALRLQSKGALRSLQAGTNPSAVLSDWAERTPSVMLARALRLLQVGYSTGGSMAKALRETAGDLLSSFALLQERAALLSTQRYTLLAAAGLLVPAILGLSLAFSVQVQSIGINSTNSAAPSSLPISFGSGKSILQAASLSISVYLLLNALLTAYFLSLLQGARERLVPYAALLILLSQAIWLLLAPAL